MILSKLKYETSIVTFAQFIAMSVLYFSINLTSVVNTCVSRSYDCLSNSISSITLSIVIVIFFACLWILGYIVQNTRSHRLALALILVEFSILAIELFDAHNFSSVLSLVTSILDAGLALWVITLAVRLYRAKGGRVIKHRTATNKD